MVNRTDGLLYQTGQGYSALDAQSARDRLDGYAVVSGLDVSPGGSLSVDVTAGEAIVGTDTNGDTITVSPGSTQNVSLTAADSSNPRKATVWIDDTGTAQVATGTAETALPEGNSRFNTFQPEPPFPGGDGTILAEVYVAAGATSLTSADIRDRRQPAQIVGADAQVASVTGAGGTGVYDDATQTVGDGTTSANHESVSTNDVSINNSQDLSSQVIGLSTGNVYSASPDGIRAALADEPGASNGAIYLPPTDFYLDSNLQITGVKTVITHPSTRFFPNGDFTPITITDIIDGEIGPLQINDASSNMTAGKPGLRIEGCGGTTFNRIRMKNMPEGVVIGNSGSQGTTGCDFEMIKGTGHSTFGLRMLEPDVHDNWLKAVEIEMSGGDAAIDFGPTGVGGGNQFGLVRLFGPSYDGLRMTQGFGFFAGGFIADGMDAFNIRVTDGVNSEVDLFIDQGWLAGSPSQANISITGTSSKTLRRFNTQNLTCLTSGTDSIRLDYCNDFKLEGMADTATNYTNLGSNFQSDILQI